MTKEAYEKAEKIMREIEEVSTILDKISLPQIFTSQIGVSFQRGEFQILPLILSSRLISTVKEQLQARLAELESELSAL